MILAHHIRVLDHQTTLYPESNETRWIIDTGASLTALALSQLTHAEKNDLLREGQASPISVQFGNGNTLHTAGVISRTLTLGPTTVVVQAPVPAPRPSLLYWAWTSSSSPLSTD